MRSKTQEWLLAHRDYPHEDWCLIWPFARDLREGRGIMGRRKTLAHRAMCEMVRGPASPDKPQATHSCGNGDQGCVNPNHLFWGSNSDNQAQRYEHGRPNRNANGNKSQFTPEQIEKIRSQWGEFTQEKLAQMYGVSIPTIQYYLKYRETRGHAGCKVNHWHPDEIEKLRNGVGRGLSASQISETIGRSRSAVEMKISRLGLKRCELYAEER
jgi:DNA-binding transcriptional regulator YiaG